MTASAATLGYGIAFTFATDVWPEGFTADGPDVDRDMVEVTNFASPSAFKEFIAGLIDGGSFTISGNYLPQNATTKAFLAALVAVPQAPAACVFTLTDTDASTISFNGLAKSFKSKAAVADKLSADFVIKITGPVTFPT